MRRRTKQLLQRIAVLIGIIALAVALFFFFKPTKTLDMASNTNNKSRHVRTIEDAKPINITLPENIVSTEENPNISSNTTNSTDKTYTPVNSNNETYFIPLQTGEKSFKLLIGYDSEKLVEGTPVEVSKEYEVKGVKEKILSIFFFKVDYYQYPILLVLGESKTLYYVDIESAYKSGNFQINGTIKNIPPVQAVNATTITKDGKEYMGAVITCTNGEGYEFDISMIGR